MSIKVSNLGRNIIKKWANYLVIPSAMIFSSLSSSPTIWSSTGIFTIALSSSQVAEAQGTRQGSTNRVMICRGGKRQTVTTKTPKATVKRLIASAKRNQLAFANRSGNCQKTSNLRAATNKKSNFDLLFLLTALLASEPLVPPLTEDTIPPTPTPTPGAGNVDPLIGTITPSEEDDTLYWFSDQALVPLTRTNFVFSRDNVRGVVNRFAGADPLGETVFNISTYDSPLMSPEEKFYKLRWGSISDPRECFNALLNKEKYSNGISQDPIRWVKGCSIWRRYLSDDVAGIDVSFRIIPSPSYKDDILDDRPGTVQINQIIFKRLSYRDGTVLAVHAPSDQLELLLSYGNRSNPNQVVRLPLIRLHESRYDIVSGFKPAQQVRDSTGQAYWVRNLVGLDGTVLGRLEYPVGGKKDGFSKVIFKPAKMATEGGASFSNFVSSGTGLAITALNSGFLEAASIQLPSTRVSRPSGWIDQLTTFLSRTPMYTNLAPNAQDENAKIIINGLNWGNLDQDALEWNVKDVIDSLTISDL